MLKLHHKLPKLNNFTQNFLGGFAPGPRWELRPQTPATAHLAALRANSLAPHVGALIASHVTLVLPGSEV